MAMSMVSPLNLTQVDEKSAPLTQTLSRGVQAC